MHDKHKFQLQKTMHWRLYGCCVFFALLAIWGGCLLFFTVQNYSLARLSVSWPVANAIITDNGKEGFMSMHEGDYVYNLFGQNHRGRRVRFFMNNRIFSGTPKRDFIAGDVIEIYINPEDAKISVVEPGASTIGFLIMLGASVVILFSGLGAEISTLFLFRHQEN